MKAILKRVSRRWFANAVLLFVTFVWGATFTLTKGAIASIPVFPYLSVRFILASLTLAALVSLSPAARRSFQWRTIWLGTVLGLFLFGTYACQTVGLKSTTPATAGFLTGLSVVFVPLLSIPLLRLYPRLRTWLGVLVAVVGLALLCGIDLVHFAIGDILVLLCAVFVALQMLFIEKYGSGCDSLALATVEIVALTVCCIVVSLCDSHTFTNLHAWLHPNVVWAVVICAVPGTSIAYWAQNVFQKFTSSAETAIIFSMEPVFATVIAWVALSESLALVPATGCLLIFLSMLIADPSLTWHRLVRRIQREV